MTNRTFHLRCSFCGKEAIEVRKLITGPQVHICDECVSLCNEILAQDGGVEEGNAPSKRLKPKELKAYLAGYEHGHGPTIIYGGVTVFQRSCCIFAPLNRHHGYTRHK